MSCCAPGTEGALDGAAALGATPSAEELLLSSRDLGEGLRQTDLSVPAVHCGACITTIENALTALAGIESARVNLTAKRVTVRWRAAQDFDPQTIVTTISSTGYAAHLFTAPLAGDDELRNQLIRAVAVSGFAAMNIMLSVGVGLVRRRSRDPRPVPLDFSPDRRSGAALCRPLLLPLRLERPEASAAPTWTCRSRSP